MKATLTVDQGNSYAKATVFTDGEVAARLCSSSLQIEEIVALASGTLVGGAIYSAVGHFDTRFVESLRQVVDGPVIAMTHSTPLPVSIGYATPSTLGLDRIAAAAGASFMFPGEALLIADSGTALTLDVVDSEGTFMCGNISPGVKLRLRSLHEYTDRLPEVPKLGDVPLFGYDTETAMRSGGRAWCGRRHCRRLPACLKGIRGGKAGAHRRRCRGSRADGGGVAWMEGSGRNGARPGSNRTKQNIKLQ